MQKTEHKTFGRPDEVREFPQGRAEIVRVGDSEIGRLVLATGLALVEGCQADRRDAELSERRTFSIT